MRKLGNAHFTNAFLEEVEQLTKEGWSFRPRGLDVAQQAVRAIGGLPGISHAVGGAVGTGKKVLKHFGKADVQQAWKGRGAGAALGAAVEGARGAATAEEGQRGAAGLRGAIRGAMIGTAAGQLATGAGRRQVVRATQRQAHALTGYTPRTQEQIARGVGRFGQGMTPRERLQAFQGMVGDARLADGMQEAAYRGLTSIPGVVKGLATKGHRLQNLKTSIKAPGTGSALMMSALAAPAIAEGVQTGDAASVGRNIGSTVGYIGGGAIPIAGNLAAGSALGRVGEGIGKGVGRLLGQNPQGQAPNV
jgi:hypothetical protein